MYIRAGMADAMLAGGVEAPMVPLGLGGFGTMRALSRRNDDPEGASRPFDLGRDGFILAEGGAVLVIEELERARARGARIYAEIVGYGMSSDAHHVTEPDPVGGNPARAMRNAMVDGGVTPDMIDYVNAHGTSTPAGDSAETKRAEAGAGRGAGLPDPDLVDQERDGAPAGRRRRPGDDHHGACDARLVRAAHHQPDRSRPGLRPRLRPQHRSGRRRPRMR